MRVNGFYWVKANGVWTIGEWISLLHTIPVNGSPSGNVSYWLVLGYNNPFMVDDELDEIDEKRITR